MNRQASLNYLTTKIYQLTNTSSSEEVKANAVIMSNYMEIMKLYDNDNCCHCAIKPCYKIKFTV